MTQGNFRLSCLAVSVSTLAILAASPAVLAQTTAPVNKAAPAPAATPAPAPAPSATPATELLEEIVVTGVLRDTVASKAPIALTTVGEERIREVVPISAADLLTEIPGVVVNSDNGEVKNSVYARGLSNGTASGTFGYYWTQMLEDGLPVTPVLYSNFQPDLFLRPDAMNKRVQAVRGGSAAVTGPNAPGGLFNYISKTGLTDPGGLASVRLGIEGDDNLYQKYEFYYGAHNEEETLGWAIGGNYRRSKGYRDIDYPLNDGGQVKGNLNYVYDSAQGAGGILVSLKYLNDRTGTLDSYRPLARGFDDPQFTEEFGRVVNFLPVGDLSHTVPFGGSGETREWDPSDFSHERSKSVGVKWDHEFGDGWSISNNLRVQENKVDHTYATDIGYQSLLNSQTFTLMGTQAAGLANTPGYFNLTDRDTGQLLARVYRITNANQNGVCVTAVSNGYCIDKNTPNLLPNQTIVNDAPIDSSNLILTVGSSNSSGVIRSRDIMDLLTVTKEISAFTITSGVYFSQSEFSRDFAYAGRGVMALENNPTTLGVSFTTTTNTTAGGAAGTTYQLTDPTGFGALGSSVGLTLKDRAKTREISPLLGVTWEATPDLLFDGGARYTFYRGWGQNRRFVTNPNAASRSFGGIDGNPLTLYDNLYAVETSASTFSYDKDTAYLQYSGAISYSFNRNTSLFARYTKGRKNQDGFWDGFSVTQKLADDYSLDPLPTIEQAELSLRYRNSWLTLNPVLFYTDLTNVPVRRNDGLLADGVTRYITKPFFSHYRSYGLELDNTIRFSSWFNIRNVLTLNRGRSEAFASISLGTCNGVPDATKCPNGILPPDDDVATYLKGPQERAALVTYNGTANFRFGDFGGYYRFRYISSRPVTVRNTYRLPEQFLSDIGLNYRINDTFSVSFNVNNLLNNTNVTQVSAVGTVPSTLTEAQLLELYPNALSQVQTNAPRSYFLTVNAKF
ncbi:MAG: TonB-dependent receptor [Niveispirillum sp.]|nr:TonB-dependent receptor [Niveispirillum sp.]